VRERNKNIKDKPNSFVVETLTLSSSFFSRYFKEFLLQTRFFAREYKSADHETAFYPRRFCPRNGVLLASIFSRFRGGRPVRWISRKLPKELRGRETQRE